MEDEAIDAVEFIKARSKEIESIEKSLGVSHKKSLHWQRMPFYRRRRSRNYDKRKFKKAKFRKLDRHFLRTHSFYAKRYTMLKVEDFSIPYSSRLKNDKYIYKSEGRGFIFDESFRKARVYDTSEIDDASRSTYLRDFDFKDEIRIQYLNNEYECILDMDRIIVTGDAKPGKALGEYDCVISVLKKHGYDFEELKDFECKVYKTSEKAESWDGDSIKISGVSRLESHKILCSRKEIMAIYQKLINGGFIPIGLKDLERLSLENDSITIYDNISSTLYKSIEEAINKDIIEKYNRTPASKKQAYNTEKLYLYGFRVFRYFIFKCIKGRCKSKGEIFCEDKCIGRVIRAGYKFRCGGVYGLGFLTDDFFASNSDDKEIYCKNIDQNDFYKITIMKYIELD